MGACQSSAKALRHKCIAVNRRRKSKSGKDCLPMRDLDVGPGRASGLPQDK